MRATAVLTPAEELGLSGMALSGLVRRAFDAIPEPSLLELFRRLDEEAGLRHLVYLRDGLSEPIRILPRPVTVLHEQLAYVQSVSLTLLNALKRLPDLYLESPAIRDALRLDEGEEAWFRGCWGPSHRENNPVFARLDAVADFTSPMWKDSLQFVEPNLGGVGGLHLLPTCEEIVADVVLPRLKERDDRLVLERGHDIRELLMQEMLDHLEAIGRPRRNLCFIEPTGAGTGPDEQEGLARYLHDRYGMKVMHADPSELSLRRGEVECAGDRVELAYRDYEVRDLLELERSGVDVEPMRALFRENRIVSSIAAEFDQKSCWEVLTDPELAGAFFHADERQVFRRHVPWTRLLFERRTLLPDGRAGDLLDFVRDDRETLVLKPNRGYGGSGVAIGHLLGQSEWESAIDAALGDGERWVVQRLVAIPVVEFPVLGPGGAVHIEPFYLVMGFAPSRYGLSVLARASQKQVVNVALRGGLCAVMVGHPPGRLVGPGPHS